MISVSQRDLRYYFDGMLSSLSSRGLSFEVVPESSRVTDGYGVVSVFIPHAAGSDPTVIYDSLSALCEKVAASGLRRLVGSSNGCVVVDDDATRFGYTLSVFGMWPKADTMRSGILTTISYHQ